MNKVISLTRTLEELDYVLAMMLYTGSYAPNGMYYNTDRRKWLPLDGQVKKQEPAYAVIRAQIGLRPEHDCSSMTSRKGFVFKEL